MAAVARWLLYMAIAGLVGYIGGLYVGLVLIR
jgi:hypothetical protein